MGGVDRWLLVYDGDCGFCRYTVDYARAVTDIAAPERVDYEPFQTAAARHPDVPLAEFATSIQLFTANGRHQGAEAAFMVLALAPRLSGWLWSYRHVPAARVLFEALYRLTARHRVAAHWLARVAFGSRLQPLAVARTARWVMAGIGIAALCAFVSWWSQAAGLIGPDGILPVSAYMDVARAQLGSGGYFVLPTLYWLSSAPWMTTALCAVGVAASVGLIVAVRPVLCALVGYVAYLSLSYGGQVFMDYQWDILLVESLLIAAVLSAQPRVGIWLARLLVFRFMLLSGAVKWLSGDPTWRNLSALDYHFETQPLPTPLAWYADHLPHVVLHAGVFTTFVIELVLPFLIFLPRNARLVAAFGFILFEVLIALTGNYNFFNLLTIVLCLALLDDRLLRAGWQRWRPQRVATGWLGVAAVALLLGLLQMHATMRGSLPRWELHTLEVIAPWRAVNSYGVFAVMTTERDELIVETSDDGEHWRALPFRYKPQALDRAPHWVAPHQPRLDWQMWFAALTTRQGAPWFDYFVVRLLTGSPKVWSLLGAPPPPEPPQAVRVLRYRYQFTTPRERAATGNWWTRQYLGVWYPAARLARPVIEPGPMEIPEGDG
jgi:predicted DCC family thiol-disulfide oxidoreductase YuxK